MVCTLVPLGLSLHGRYSCVLRYHQIRYTENQQILSLFSSILFTLSPYFLSPSISLSLSFSLCENYTLCDHTLCIYAHIYNVKGIREEVTLVTRLSLPLCSYSLSLSLS